MNIPLYHKHSHLSKGKLTTIVVAILLLFVTYTATAAYYYEPDKTPENVQKKAVIIKHDARLFNDATGFRGSSTQFMHIYFLMKPTRHTRLSFRKKYDRGNRVAVSVRPYKTGRPDGWLDIKSFVEWNTLQMIKLEPQSGRKLAKIFKNRYCAKLFGKKGKVKRGCQVLGTEPNRFTSKTDFQLLIPVFKKRRKIYQGGFIRVYEKDSAVRAAHASLKMQTPSRLHNQRHRLGYDIVFVVGHLKSHLTPTMEVLQTVIKLMQQSVSNGKDMPLRIGVLFYRPRADRTALCRGYLSKWGQHLTTDVNRVIDALASEKEDTCSNEHKNDAVLDALNRVLSGTQWKDNHFKSIILVGDAPPYPVYDRKNPMRLSVYLINKRALKKNVRIITFKLGNDDRAYKKLALDTIATNRGRYYNIPISKDNIQMFKQNLFKAMTDEWRMLEIAQSMVDYSSSENTQGINRAATGVNLLDEPAFRRKYNITQYEALIIRARLPNTTTEASVVAPKFIKGWIPQEIQNQLAVGEFIFMDKFNLKTLTNALGRIADAALIGSQDGSMAFISSIRHVLAAQTRVPTNRLFRSGESLAGTLQKAKILPFRTDILTFTAQEVNTWKPADYRRINTILKEKVKVLVEFMGNPKNSHYFGNTQHFYVPRAFFP